MHDSEERGFLYADYVHILVLMLYNALLISAHQTLCITGFNFETESIVVSSGWGREFIVAVCLQNSKLLKDD